MVTYSPSPFQEITSVFEMDSSKVHSCDNLTEKLPTSSDSEEAESSTKTLIVNLTEKSVTLGESCDDCLESSVPFKNVPVPTSETAPEAKVEIDIGIVTVPCERCKNGIVMKCEKSTNSESTSVWKEYRGILFSLASGLASTFGGIIVKYMDFHPFSLATYRFQGILLPTLLIVLYYKFVNNENVFRTIWPITDKDKLKKFGFTIIRAVIGCLGLYLYFYAIKLMPLADAKVILSCRPIFVIYVAHLFLGEPCGVFPVVASLFAVVGVAVISRPPILTGERHFDSNTMMGTIFATLSMIVATLSMVVLRYLREVHVAVVTLAFGFWGTILSMTCSLFTDAKFDVAKSSSEWILVSCLAASAFFSQTAITLAMKYENAGAVVIVGTCDTIMSFILQYLILGDIPDLYSILGAVVIVICVSLITIRKWIKSLPEQHSIRKRFAFVLK